MWSKLIALAVTIPMTITIASAQASQDADIAAYSQDLAMRIARGQQSGQLSPANYNSVQALYNNVEMIRRGIGNKPMNPVVRMNMMNSLTNLDKQLTGFLHDDVNSRFQMWDPTRKSWRNNWWQADRSGANNFDSEIDAYQNSLRQRLAQGRQSGKISRRELAQLTNSYSNVDRMQQQYRIGGFSSYERNSLMSMLTQLDKDITAQMHDDNNSHYRNWNPNNKGWNNSWWKQSNTSSTPARDGRPGDWNNRSDSGNRGEWNRSDSHRGDSSNRDWNRGNSNQTDWKRGDGVQSHSNTKDWNGGNSNRSGWNNRAGFRQNNDSVNRTSNPSGGTASGANSSSTSSSGGSTSSTSSSGGSTSSGNTTKTYTTPPTTPAAYTTPPVSNTPPATTSTPPVSNPPATTNPSSGAGSASTGSSSGEGRRGTWGGQRSGEGRGDRNGTWERRPQN